MQLEKYKEASKILENLKSLEQFKQALDASIKNKCLHIGIFTGTSAVNGSLDFSRIDKGMEVLEKKVKELYYCTVGVISEYKKDFEEL